jgi:hypothetical protein
MKKQFARSAWRVGIFGIFSLGFFILPAIFYPLPPNTHELTYVLHPRLNPVYPVYAQETESTPSSTIQSKLKSLQEEIASKAAKIKQEITKRLQNKAYIGYVKSKSDHSITLAVKSGTKIITVNEYSLYADDFTPPKNSKAKPRKVSSLATLQPDDYIAALGDIDDSQILTAKKIVRINPPQTSDKQLEEGVVTQKTATKITIRKADNQTQPIAIDEDTTFQTLGKTSNEEALQINQKIIVVLIKQSTDAQNPSNPSFKARYVYMYPFTTSTPTPEPSQSASPSAQPTLSPTSSPKATSKSTTNSIR